MAIKNGEKMVDEPGGGRERTQFKPGWSGGPGRPPNDKSITDKTRKELNRETTVPVKNAEGEETGKRTVTYLQLFVESQIKRAINGDSAAAKNIWDRMEGRVIEQIEHSTPLDGFNFVVTYVKPDEIDE